jgi:NADPH2:quinone reductase
VTPGQEVSGEVVATPDGSAFNVGDRVMGVTPFGGEGLTFGGMADYAYVREPQTLHVPDGLSVEEAAGFLVGFRTAYAALVQRLPVAAGDVLVVLGAAGSSGVTAVSLGKALSATVIAVAGSDEKLEFCKSIGADHALSYKSGDFVQEILDLTDGRGADAIFDPVGGETATKSLKAIARFGRIGIVGFAAGGWVTLDPLDMVLRSYSAVGVFAAAYTAAEDRDAYAELFNMAQQGRIRTPVGKVYGFDEAIQAIQAMASPLPGKHIVRVSPT